MRNRLYRSSWAVALMLGVAISCGEPDPAQTDLSGDKLNQKSLTELELVERRTGLTFYKQDVVVFDASGKNSLTFRFASLNERLLNDYVKSSKYTFTPVRDRGSVSDLKKVEPNIDPGSPEAENGELDYNSRVLIEVVNKSFEPGVIGFSLNVKTQPIGSTSSGRTKAWVWAQMISPTWPEEIHVYNYTTDYVHWKLKKKNYTIDCCWGPYFLTVTQYAEHLGWDIDGPYRVLIDIQWNNSLGTYNVVWVAV